MCVWCECVSERTLAILHVQPYVLRVCTMADDDGCSVVQASLFPLTPEFCERYVKGERKALIVTIHFINW